MLDDAFSEILPSGMGFWILLFFGGREDVRGAEMGAETLGDDGPTHELRDGEELEELAFVGDKGVPGVGMDAMEEIGLFVVVGGEEDVIDYSLKNLGKLSYGRGKVRRGL